MNYWYVDEGHVTHSWRGFEWSVRRVGVARWLIGHAIEEALSVIGHPCCGRGIGRIDAVFEVSHWLVDWAIRFGDGREMIALPLDSAQARTLSDSVLDELADPEGLHRPLDGIDEDAYEWRDGRFVAYHCPECGLRVPATSWPTDTTQQHIDECTGNN